MIFSQVQIYNIYDSRLLYLLSYYWGKLLGMVVGLNYSFLEIIKYVPLKENHMYFL